MINSDKKAKPMIKSYQISAIIGFLVSIILLLIPGPNSEILAVLGYFGLVASAITLMNFQGKTK